MVTKPTRVLLAAVLLVCCGSGVSSAQWMSQIPTAQNGTSARTFLEACLNMDDWPTVLSVTNELGSISADIMAADEGQLRTCLSNMRAQGLTLTVEVTPFQPGGGGECGDGEHCFTRDTLPMLQKLDRNGPRPPTRLRFDEPLKRAVERGISREEAVNQTVIYLAYLHDRYSDIRATSIEPYPTLLSAEDINWWMRALTAACQAAGVPPPDSFELDHDVYHGTTRWWDIPNMVSQAHSLGWTFGYIFGSPVRPGWSWRDTAYYQGSNLRVYAVPDVFVFEDWDGANVMIVPEDPSRYTFMGTVYQFRASGLFPR